jgi:hypothetical protein
MFVSSGQSNKAASALARLISYFWVRLEPPDQLRTALREAHAPTSPDVDA